MELKLLTYLIVFAGVINLLRMTLFLIGSDIYSVKAAKRAKKSISDNFIPSFSIIIPARNEGTTVIRAIKSVLQNNYPKERLHIIIVDDGSTDTTAKTVSQFIEMQKNSSIQLIKQANAGKAHALNNGIINYATGDLIMCLDADSYIKENALRNAAKHFINPKVMAMSANVKIAERHGLLNIIQRYEYLICYQMKRAESLLNCEYIVGGIGSVFRRTMLEKINYYDTNTVTEDIDITMKVLRVGNKDNKVIYGSDVVAYTESVMSVADLIKQRFRWKWGRTQTFLKNKSMFFSRDARYTKSLSMFYLPFAIFGDIMYFLEPILLTYIIALSIIYQNPTALINAWIVISSYLILNILAEDTFTKKEKIKFIAGAPFMYGLFYILSFVEYVALLKSIVKLPSLRASLTDSKTDWVRVARPTEHIYAPSFGTKAMPYAVAIVVLFSAIAGIFTYVHIEKLVHADSSSKQIQKPKTVEKLTSTDVKMLEHVVQQGESLWMISKAYYGKGALWKNIQVTSGDSKLQPGEVVGIPDLQTAQ